MEAARVPFLLFTYLVAAIPFGVVVTRLAGGTKDLATTGSGNIGATNVARVYSWRLAIIVLLLDAAKGFVPVWLSLRLWPDAPSWWTSTVVLCTVFAHIFPLYLRFRGGKGVATSAGALLAVSPQIVAPSMAVWVATLVVSRRSSVAALAASIGLVAASSWLEPEVMPLTGALGLVILLTHTANIQRLFGGREPHVVGSKGPRD